MPRSEVRSQVDIPSIAYSKVSGPYPYTTLLLVSVGTRGEEALLPRSSPTVLYIVAVGRYINTVRAK